MSILARQGGLAAFFALSAAASGLATPRSEPAAVTQPSAPLPKIKGWKVSDGPTTYSPETLFEYIDGGAESFLQFDFQGLTSATYAKVDAATEITVDIYHHKDAMRAFGMYTQERPAGTTPVPVGVEGYSGPDYLEFVIGSYYVKLVQQGTKQPSLLRPFAEKLAASLPGTREAPAVLKVFPDRGKRVRAEKLAARNFLGQPFLHDAAAVPYEIGGASFRLFVVEGRDDADVRAMVQRYRTLAKIADANPVGPQGSATVKDPLNGEVVLRWKGRWLWGAVDQSCAERQSLVDELGRNLSTLNK